MRSPVLTAAADRRFRETRLADLPGLSTISLNLAVHGLTTVGAVRERSDHQLLSLPWIGVVSVRKLRAAIEEERRRLVAAAEIRPVPTMPGVVVGAPVTERIRALCSRHAGLGEDARIDNLAAIRELADEALRSAKARRDAALAETHAAAIEGFLADL